VIGKREEVEPEGGAGSARQIGGRSVYGIDGLDEKPRLVVDPAFAAQVAPSLQQGRVVGATHAGMQADGADHGTVVHGVDLVWIALQQVQRAGVQPANQGGRDAIVQRNVS